MAKRKNNTTAELDARLERHIRSIGLETTAQYQAWCSENGLSTKLHKRHRLRVQEYALVQNAKVMNRLAQKRREIRKPLDMIFAICDGKIDRQDIPQGFLLNLQRSVLSFGNGNGHGRRLNVDFLKRLLKHLQFRRVKFITDTSPVIESLGYSPGNTYIEALTQIATYPTAAIRPIEDWKPKSHNSRKQFASLLRHLFVRHSMPALMDAAWFAGHSSDGSQYRRWYLMIGKGQSIREADLPLEFSKRMGHHFMQAPADLSIPAALRFSQVLALGGSKKLAKAICEIDRLTQFQNENFWKTVVEWFIRHPMLDTSQVNPIVDYLNHQRFELPIGLPVAGVQPLPAQPRLCMKGRDPASLIRHVDAWHRSLARNNRIQLQQWPATGIDGLEQVEGQFENENFAIWRIRELLSTKALYTEGRDLKHCVASYSGLCFQGRTSIWTLERDSVSGTKKLLTVEVNPRTRRIIQARGKLNRMPTEQEARVLRLWCAKSGLTLSSIIG